MAGMRADREALEQFASIEAAYEYVTLLAEAALEARVEIARHEREALQSGVERRQQALGLTAHKLSQLNLQLCRSRRLLNDLRTLRRLLFAERAVAAPGAAFAPATRPGVGAPLHAPA